ncbi:MAG: hypothetical protein H5T75_01030 [Coriobacteriia bacterium]|nr:hypothetical protein [Coriobacteriia bacterium]MDI6843273.1 hypothetical protein [Anaerosomatales bacterium]GAV32096.1 hypothetical protein emb_1d0743 [Coriobacteriaceae bacterium EMTCatB1]
MDAYSPIKGKCQFWREQPDEDDAYSLSVKPEDKRIRCTCWVDGDLWVFKASEVPSDCPRRMQCRYYIKTG